MKRNHTTWRALFLAWDQWWSRKSYPHTMGIVRIVVGGWLLFYWAIRMPYVTILFSEEGIVLPTYPTYLPEYLEWIWQVPSAEVALIIYAVHLLALFCITIGFRTRTAASIAFLLSWYYYYLSLHLFHTSYDRLYILILLLLAASHSSEIFSYKAWAQYGSPLKWKQMISVFPQRMIAVQMSITYFGVGWQKIWLPGWQGGEMLWYSMLGVWGTPLAFWITSFGWSNAYHVLVNLTKLLEWWLPFGFWIKKHYIRWWTMLGGLVFHVLVDMLLYIWWFAVLIPAYIVYFEPEETYAFLKKRTKGWIT